MPRKLKHEGHTKEEAREELKDVVGCLSCGLPTRRTQREAASELIEICPKCRDQHGHLRSYEEVFERLVTGHFMKKEKLSRPEAESAARAKMSELPVWRDLKT